ncbi:hypothetical protein C8A01DRAFT_34143 [Parachaetomium inaequale]|uniref:Uncharacterized protein n=1 Tax=Parachaetomium inaequale TaxID=2588326 RepID=A0AAN6SSR0_9PEZI|nr:hypothetical protein C8A01DRAFT_34143 [Parachaetomium inaequale]
MSPTYTMSAHLCKQIYSSWRQAHPQPSPDPSPLPSPPTAFSSSSNNTASYLSRPSSPTAEKRSMDSDRGEPSSSGGNWRWGSR